MKTHRLWILLATLLAPGAVYAQIYRLAEMNSDQVRALDHEKTVIPRADAWRSNGAACVDGRFF